MKLISFDYYNNQNRIKSLIILTGFWGFGDAAEDAEQVVEAGNFGGGPWEGAGETSDYDTLALHFDRNTVATAKSGS